MGADPTATKIWASCVCRYSCNNCSCWNRTNIKWFRVTCTTVILTNSKSQCRRTIPNYKCHKLACYQLHHTRDEVVLHQGLGPWTRWLRVSYSTNWVNGAFRALGEIWTPVSRSCSPLHYQALLQAHRDYCGNLFKWRRILHHSNLKWLLGFEPR